MTVNKWDNNGMIKMVDIKKRNKLIARLNLEDSEREAKKRRLNLMSLEESLIGGDGQARCFLEIEFLDNGDAYVNFSGQNKKGIFHYVSAQIPNPINGGGNWDDYQILVKIYKILKK